MKYLFLFAVAAVVVMAVPAGAKEMPSRFTDWFPITGWWGPSKDQVTSQVYTDMAEAGLTLSLSHPDWAVDLGRKAGLKMIVYNTDVHHSCEPNGGISDSASDKAVDLLVAAHGKDPDVVGFTMKDEPLPPLFPRLARVNKRLREKAPGCFPFINLLPTYAAEFVDNPEAYEMYVRRFVKEVDPAILCFDHYPFPYDTMHKDYYTNLDIIRRVAEEADIPFWGFIQLTAHGGGRECTEAELRMQVFSHLVYGAKGISYFCYWLPAPEKENRFYGAVVDDTGRRTEHFYSVQRINQRVQAMGKHLINMRLTGVYHTGNMPQTTHPLPKDAPVQPKEGWTDGQRMFFPGGQLIYGFFDDPKGDKWVMIVNRDYAHIVRTRLSLGAGVKALEEVGGPEPTGSQGLLPDKDDKDRLVTLRLRPGDGRLFKMIPSDKQ